MSDVFWQTVFAIGIVQGVFLFVALLLRRSTNRTAARTLALIVGVFTLMILGGVLTQALEPRLAQLVAYLNINTELAIGPLFPVRAGAGLPQLNPTQQEENQMPDLATPSPTPKPFPPPPPPPPQPQPGSVLTVCGSWWRPSVSRDSLEAELAGG